MMSAQGNMPNPVTAEKAAVPQSANPTTVIPQDQTGVLRIACMPSGEVFPCATSSVAAYLMSIACMHLQGNVVTKAGAVPAAGVAAPGDANPLTGTGAAESTTTTADHAEPADEPAK